MDNDLQIAILNAIDAYSLTNRAAQTNFEVSEWVRKMMIRVGREAELENPKFFITLPLEISTVAFIEALKQFGYTVVKKESEGENR